MTTYRVMERKSYFEPIRYVERFSSDSLLECVAHIKTLDNEEYKFLFVMKDVCYPMDGGSIFVSGEGDTWFDAK